MLLKRNDWYGLFSTLEEKFIIYLKPIGKWNTFYISYKMYCVPQSHVEGDFRYAWAIFQRDTSVIFLLLYTHAVKAKKD